MIKKISTKIILTLVVLLTISSSAVVYFSTAKVKSDSISITKENLEMLNTAMFQSLRNTMTTGDMETIQKAKKDICRI